MRREDLEIFLHLATSGSLSATSRALKLPKSSISRLLARLESDAGQALFDRSTRHFRLTDAGTLLRPYADNVVSMLSEAQSVLDGFAGEPQGLLRVNSTASFAQGLIAPLLPAYLNRYPRMRVELTTDSRYIDVIQEGVDLVVRVGALADSAMFARRLPAIELLLCASPAYLATAGTPKTVDDLAHHHVVAREHKPQWTFRNGVHERTLRLSARAMLPDAGAQAAVVLGGGGFACLPSYVVASAIRNGVLIHVLPDWRREPIAIHAVYPSQHRISGKVRSFVDALAQHLESQSGGTEG